MAGEGMIQDSFRVSSGFRDEDHLFLQRRPVKIEGVSA
jgi:hypothetical protein